MTPVRQQDWSRIGDVPSLIARLYEIVDELEAIFPGRHFTPDGHLVGSIGESLAAYMFGLELTTASTAACDAVTKAGVRVEIKATQGPAVSLSAAATPSSDERLVVFQLTRNKVPEVVFNGRADRVWDVAGLPQKNGQRRIGLGQLRALDANVHAEERLPLERSLDAADWTSNSS